MSAHPIDRNVRIGHVHLKVADLERSLRFYSGVLGFELTQRYGDGGAFVSAGGYHHHLAKNTCESRDGGPPPPGSTGLYHVAILYPTRAALADALLRLREAKIPLEGASDHGVSEALYLRDPDDNGVELYWDRPRQTWPRDAHGNVAMFTRPLDLQALLRAAAPTSEANSATPPRDAAAVDVRPLSEPDLPAVLEITNHYILHTAINFHTEPVTPEALAGEWAATRERYPWLVASEDGVIVGYAKASAWKPRRAYDPTAEVTVYIHPDHHRRGVGRALYEALFAELAARGFVTLLAGITLPNDASVGLHESLGFRRAGVFERVGRKFEKWHDVGYWVKHLDG
jgi:catechol 2,3-dioxygenase